MLNHLELPYGVGYAIAQSGIVYFKKGAWFVLTLDTATAADPSDKGNCVCGVGVKSQSKTQ